MPQVHGNFTQLTDFDPVLTEIFYQQYALVTPLRERIFGLRNSTKGKETDLRIGSFSDPKVFNGGVEYQTIQRDYDITYTHTAYADGFVVEREMMDDMQYDGIFSAASEMGTAFARKQEKDAASVFNNAFSSSFLGYDSKALCADDHPRSRTDTTAVDNALTLTLTSANLETAITTMQAFGDDKGNEISIMPDILLVPRNLRKKAFELCGSPLSPEDANNAINVHSGMTPLVWPYLTDQNAWFVIDSVMAKRYLKWYSRIAVEFAAQDDFDTFMRKYRGYMRYSKGWSDFRWVIGSNPS
jgi:phage major head subunit gpT-like protein